MSNLLIVESPAKCKKIQGFLGPDWRVTATMGHIRALKEDLTAIGFDPADGQTQHWHPTYEAIQSKKAAIAALRSAAKAATTVYLGADDDREGEAIAWHTCQILGLNPATANRVVFHEITAPALKAAVSAPRRIDLNKFNAQQARTMLDMLIGFTLSPCLWRGVGYKQGLSAGRCQTPALRIIYDRDREIENHQATNTWRLSAITEDCIEDSTLEWRDPTSYADADAVTAVLTTLTGVKAPKTLTVIARAERTATSAPPKPFITSSLQQEASNRMSMNPKVTMKTAQTLYEAGHITYMRTDNAILSQEAIEAASAVVKERWGEEYLSQATTTDTDAPAPKKKIIKKKAAAESKQPEKPEAQAAHEGIRPTHMDVASGDELEGMGPQERRLYELIWNRTIQSVMAPEKRDVVKLTATPTGLQKPQLTTEWDQVGFAGWCILDHERKGDQETANETAVFAARADLDANTLLDWQTITANEVRSSPPARYTEASLIRELEHRGIGRPSTYATLVDTVMERGYVEKATITATPVKLGVLTLTPTAKAPKRTDRTEKAGAERDKVRTTPLGRTVIEWLLVQFGDMLEYDFTAAMEASLDEVAKGDRTWPTVLTDTWTRYADRYAAVMASKSSSTSSEMATTSAAGGLATSRSSADTPVRFTSAAGGLAASRSSANKAEFGDGLKLVVSRKGPLFVWEREGQQTRFASVPSHLSVQTATRADAVAAFATATANTEGTNIGELEGKPVIRKKGQYGFYVTWSDARLTCKETDTLETLTPQLQAKVTAAAEGTAVDHTVGAYKIKRGPYGLYMFKTNTGSKTKPTFVSVPEGTPYATLTPEGAEQLYKHCMEAKKAGPKRGGKKTADS
jgi:DNA topoisomerase I